LTGKEVIIRFGKPNADHILVVMTIVAVCIENTQFWMTCGIVWIASIASIRSADHVDTDVEIVCAGLKAAIIAY